MLVGLISDTHDRLPFIAEAVKRLNQEKVDLVLHTGDYIAGFAVQHLRSLEAPLIGVFGNNDGDQELLKEKFKELGAELRGRFAEIKVENSRIAMLHGEEGELLNSLIGTKSYDFIVHGHTHEVKIYRKGRTLIVNPGEVCGYLSGKATIGILDTEKHEARIIRL